MALVQTESLPKNSLKLTITVPFVELQPFLEEAAQHLSEHKQIPGFRPGKAGYDVVKQHVGEMQIYEEALESVVRKTFVEAIQAQKLETVGSPAIELDKMAPGNDLIYSATVVLMPSVEVLADFRSLALEGKSVSVPDKDVDRVLGDLQRMQTKEARVGEGYTAGTADKVVINMDMRREGVPLEGGQAVGHAVYLNESYYIPGFAEQLTGLTEGGQKTFSLKFPTEHYQPHLAGQDVEFDVTVKEIYQLEHPTLDDAFAASVGQPDITSLKQAIRGNLEYEKGEEERVRVEREMLEMVANASRFGDIPDLLLNEEINKMVEELKAGAAEQETEFDDYLKRLKKTLPELKLELTPAALMRIKVTLVIRDIARKEDVTVSAEEVDKELDTQAERQTDKETKDRIYSPLYRDYMEVVMRNRKVIELLKSAIVKTPVRLIHS